VRIARDSGLFTYLRDTAAEARIVIADGRLALAETPAGSFDLIVLDAFNSSAVPVHLLTREALGADLERLAPTGILAVHVSSRYADLEPVVAAAADELGAAAVARSDPTDPARAGDEDGSDWVVLAREPGALAPLRSDQRWRDARRMPGASAWTDDHADVASVIRWGR
jgi:spermidine synthase